MWQALEIAALEEALPDVLDAPLHLGLVLGVSHLGGVGDEVPALGVFQEAPGEDGMQRVRSRHRRREIVDDQVPRDAAEEGSGRLQASDDVLQLLAKGGPDEAVPRVGQHHDQGPHRPAVSRVRIGDQTQPAEIHLRHLAGSGILHAHGGPAALAPVAFLNEAAQRLVRYPAAAAQQQLVNTGQLQPVPADPLVDLVGPRSQQVLAGRLRLPWPRLADGHQPDELVLAGKTSFPGNAPRLRRGEILADRVPRQAGARCDLTVPLARLPSPDDFLYFHSGNLPERPTFEVRQWSPLRLLNQYQGGMCISGRLTMTERTPRHLISPLGPNWVGTDSAV